MIEIDRDRVPDIGMRPVEDDDGRCRGCQPDGRSGYRRKIRRAWEKPTPRRGPSFRARRAIFRQEVAALARHSRHDRQDCAAGIPGRTRQDRDLIVRRRGFLSSPALANPLKGDRRCLFGPSGKIIGKGEGAPPKRGGRPIRISGKVEVAQRCPAAVEASESGGTCGTTAPQRDASEKSLRAPAAAFAAPWCDGRDRSRS